jgi:16S rRNA (uracil1498-N3)-methyltransferase
MRLHRFNVSQPLGEEVVIDTVSLIDQWRKVFRYTHGQEVILFNGDGFDVVYEIQAIAKNTCELKKVRSYAGTTPQKETHLFLSLIKKDNLELVVQKATELGITHIHLITSERVERKNFSFDRLVLIAREALEQCGRSDSVAIALPVSLTTALETHALPLRCFTLHMDGEPLLASLSKTPSVPRPAAFFVGPEGGWSPEEMQMFAHYAVERVSLSTQVLRAETAAIACVTLACY